MGLGVQPPGPARSPRWQPHLVDGLSSGLEDVHIVRWGLVDGDRCRTDLRDPLDDPEPLRVVVGGSEYSEDGVVELVDEELPDKVTIPSVSREQESSDVFLEESDAEALLSWFRNSTRWYGTIQHTILEVTWHTGARMGGLRGLDLGDYQREEQYLLFRHRPETETTLKNKLEGERAPSRYRTPSPTSWTTTSSESGRRNATTTAQSPCSAVVRDGSVTLTGGTSPPWRPSHVITATAHTGSRVIPASGRTALTRASARRRVVPIRFGRDRSLGS